MSNLNDNVVSSLTDIMKNFETRLTKNEQLVLHTFSYLYCRCDNVSDNYSYIRNNISNIYQELANIQSIVSSLSSQVVEHTIIEQTINAQEENPPVKQEIKKHIKRKRPWHYFISKYFRYRTLLKLKTKIEEDIILKNKEKQRQLEEQQRELEKQRIKELEEKLKQEESRRKELEENRKNEEQQIQDRRRKAKLEMNRILSNLK